MKSKRIRAGFIGLNPDSHWASKSHIPALRFLSDDYEIKGVANTSHASAKAAAEALQIPLAFENAQALLASPEIDLVVVTVKVPFHLDLVKAALEAGKHVYCEHPLGRNLQEAKELAALAGSKNAVAVVGMQMAAAPEIHFLKQLIAEGYVGKVLSTTLIGSGGNWRDETVADLYYMYQRENGATMLTIPLGHTLKGLTAVLGNIGTLTGRTMHFYNEVRITDTGETKPKTADDQIMAIGTMSSGAAISVHYRGGVSRATNLLWEINGSTGDIQVTAPIGHGQLAPLTIRGASGEKELKVLTLPDALTEGLPESPMVRNVARMYQLLAGDIRNGTRNAPAFQDAVELQAVLEGIEKVPPLS